jgi:hypothetical protein
LVYGDGRGQGRTEWVVVRGEDGVWRVRFYEAGVVPAVDEEAVGVWLVRDGVTV